MWSSNQYTRWQWSTRKSRCPVKEEDTCKHRILKAVLFWCVSVYRLISLSFITNVLRMQGILAGMQSIMLYVLNIGLWNKTAASRSIETTTIWMCLSEYLFFQTNKSERFTLTRLIILEVGSFETKWQSSQMFNLIFMQLGPARKTTLRCEEKIPE
jgi:hypothetical protein